MNNRWTIKQLNETDDLTFAMCILSERREMLNQEAPLAKKLAKAFHALEELRDICRANPDHALGIVSTKEAIFRKVEYDYLLEDLKNHLEDESYNSVECLEEYGLSAEDVLGDKGMMSRIVELFHKHDGENDYWSTMDFAVTQGIKDILEIRKGATNGQYE